MKNVDRERFVIRFFYVLREYIDNLFYVNCIFNFNIKF